MSTLIAYSHIQQAYPFEQVAQSFYQQRGELPLSDSPRVRQRFECQKLAHFLLAQLAKVAGISTALLAQIYRTPSGRPQLPTPNIDFNISHSDNWVAVMLNVAPTAQSAVGIDIEFIKRQRNYHALLSHFASPLEQQWFAQQPDAEQAFYRIWCGREAMLKSQGVGIVKLSEVQHFPEQLILRSAYCPAGELLFSDQFPFYLAAFGEQSAVQNLRFFMWENQQLQAISVNKKLIYRVNSPQ